MGDEWEEGNVELIAWQLLQPYKNKSKMKQYLLLFTLILIIAGAACKKENGEKIRRCRISRITDVTANQSSAITYDKEGRYQTVKSDDGRRSINFEYTGSTIISRIYGANEKMTHKVTTVINENKMAWIQMEETFDASGNLSNSWNYTYEYIGNELRQSTYSIANTTPRVTTYIWNTGDNTEVKNAVGGITYYEYYTDKADQQGNYWNLRMLHFGIDQRLIIQTKSLFKGFRGYDQFAYTFDDQGYITSVSEDGELKYTLQYSCE